MERKVKGTTSFQVAVFTLITAAVFIAVSGSALAAQHESPAGPPNISTFSVVAYDPNTGEVGAIVQSKFFAVGSLVIYADSSVGAIASQAYGNPYYGTEGMELMRHGLTPEEAINLIARYDMDAERRQVGMVSTMEGGMAHTYTGSECMDWAGGLTGVAPDGVVYSVQGNILTGQDVVGAMAFAMEHGELPEEAELTDNEVAALGMDDFVGRLLLAMLAGQAMGGDSRGMQSAALLVAQPGMGYGGYTDVKYDLRVDDAEDPFDELARLLNLARPFALTNEGYNVLYAGEYEKAVKIFSYLAAMEPDYGFHHYNLACALSLSGQLEGAMVELEIALGLEESLRQHASQDPDLEPLHEMDGFDDLVVYDQPEE